MSTPTRITIQNRFGTPPNEPREKVWKAFKKRGDNGDKNDTNATIVQIVRLRAERAKLLGYASHAHWRMSDTMAVDPKKADELMSPYVEQTSLKLP